MSRLHFINTRKDYDVPFHALLLNLSALNERKDDYALSNFSLHYDIHILSNFRECSKRRQIMSRMHHERQSYMLDIIEDYVDTNSGERVYIFKGTLGLIKVNRVNKEASLIYLIDRSLLDDLSYCFQHVVNFAKRQGYSLNRINCRVIVDTAGEMVIPILTSSSFYKTDEAIENDVLITSFACEVSSISPANPSPFQLYNSMQDRSAVRVDSFSPVPRYAAPNADWQLTPSATAAMTTVNGAKYFYPIVSPVMASEGTYPLNFNVDSMSQSGLSSIETGSSFSHPKYAYNIVETDSIDSKSYSTKSDYSNPDYSERDLNRPSIDPSIYNIPSTPPVSPVSSVGWDREANINESNKYNKCCIFWLKGVCMYGHNCHYRHSVTPDVQLSIDTGESTAARNQFEEPAIPDGISEAYSLFLDFVNNANSNWLSGLRCPSLGKDREASTANAVVERVDTPSMSTMRSQIPKNTGGSNSSVANMKSCYMSITAAMVDSLMKRRQTARERTGPASNPFSSVEECLEVLCIDPLWMNSVLLINKDICSEYRNVVRTLLKADANYSFTWPGNSSASESFPGPASPQFYPYQQQQQMSPYMYYSPMSPQPPTAAANVVYSSPTVIPCGVPYIPQNRLPSSAEGIVHTSSYTDSSEINYRKPCEFRKPDIFPHPSSPGHPPRAQDSILSAEAPPVIVVVTEQAATRYEESSALSSAESSQGCEQTMESRNNSATSDPEIRTN